MSDLDAIREALEATPKPVCAALVAFEVLEADRSTGRVRVRFAPQPAFGNHFGHVQGGFIVAMLDTPLSLAVFVKTGRWIPTIEIKTSFVAPAPIDALIGEGSVLRAGSSLIFHEARLLTADGKRAHTRRRRRSPPRRPDRRREPGRPVFPDQSDPVSATSVSAGSGTSVVPSQIQ